MFYPYTGTAASDIEQNPQFAYYEHLGVTAVNYSAAATKPWMWMCSAAPDKSDSSFMYIYVEGFPHATGASDFGGIRPCFCL